MDVACQKAQQFERAVRSVERAGRRANLSGREERGAHRATSAPSALNGIRTMRPLTGSAFSSMPKPSLWLWG